MKKIIILLIGLLQIVAVSAQTAKQVMDKCAKTVNIKQGAKATFNIEGGNISKTSGTITIKGEKYQANTPQASIWYNGKTQWTYMKGSDEVNITTPSAADRQKVNPYNFISLYKNGYKLDLKTEGGKYIVHMTKAGASIPELYVSVDKKTYQPTTVRMKQKKGWLTINLTSLKSAKVADSAFTFNVKDYPKAEIIDLR